MIGEIGGWLGILLGVRYTKAPLFFLTGLIVVEY